MAPPVKRSVPLGWPAEWPIPEVAERTEASSYLHAEASRLVNTQKALLAGGYIKEPDENVLRKAVSFHNVARFMDMCAPHRARVLEFLKRLHAERDGR